MMKVSTALVMIATMTVPPVKISVNALKVFIQVMIEPQLDHAWKLKVLSTVNVLAKEPKTVKVISECDIECSASRRSFLTEGCNGVSKMMIKYRFINMHVHLAIKSKLT